MFFFGNFACSNRCVGMISLATFRKDYNIVLINYLSLNVLHET